MTRHIELVVRPIIDSNPITLQILGICSALAVTTSLSTALTMCAALTVVLMFANGIISLIRNHIPPAIRLIIQITIVASLVIVIDQILRAYAFELSQRLSIFVGLIVTNCIVLGRIEAFAMRNAVWPSVLDGLGNGIGYSVILATVASIRELLGTGTLLGYTILTTVRDGGWFEPLGFMLLAPSAFFIIGLLIWLVRSLKPSQIEQSEFRDLAHGKEMRS